MSPEIALFARGIFELAFYILIIIFAFHALFLGYHLFTYGDSAKLSLTAFALYLAGGAFIFLALSITLTII